MTVDDLGRAALNPPAVPFEAAISTMKNDNRGEEYNDDVRPPLLVLIRFTAKGKLEAVAVSEQSGLGLACCLPRCLV